MTTTTTYGLPPAPADAVDVYPWYQDPHSDKVARSFTGTRRNVDLAPGYTVLVDVSGVQSDDGRVERLIGVKRADGLTPAKARELAAALVAAADEADQLGENL